MSELEFINGMYITKTKSGFAIDMNPEHLQDLVNALSHRDRIKIFINKSKSNEKYYAILNPEYHKEDALS